MSRPPLSMMLFVLGNDELHVNGELLVDRLLENAVVEVLLLIDPLFSKMLFMLVLARELFEAIDRLWADVVPASGINCHKQIECKPELELECVN